MENATFRVTIDKVAYTHKPDPIKDATAITRRLQQNGGIDCTAKQLCRCIELGFTFVGGVYKPCNGSWGEFEGQQIFALDFDNAAPVRNAEGGIIKGKKRPLEPGESGYLCALDALNRCYDELFISPLCLYFTMGARFPDWEKFRIVFDAGEQLDKNAAKQQINALLLAFPEADQACKNSNRLFYASNGEVWPCYLSDQL